MPVDEEINLDNPEGITQDDLDRMNEIADELEELAQSAEGNSQRIDRAKKSLEGMDFATKNIISKSMGGDGTGAGIDTEVLMKQIVEIMEQLEKAKEERKNNKTEAEKNAEAIKKAEAERKKEIARIRSEIHGYEGTFNEIQSATSSPIGFVKGRLMGVIGKAGILGAVITVTYHMIEKLWGEYMKTFEAGGTNDIRKMMEDRDKEMMELNDILARRNGRVFFTGDTDLRQGAPQFSNTERLRDQVLRYQSLHLGE